MIQLLQYVLRYFVARILWKSFGLIFGLLSRTFNRLLQSRIRIER
jgi:hypothetical protein